MLFNLVWEARSFTGAILLVHNLGSQFHAASNHQAPLPRNISMDPAIACLLLSPKPPEALRPSFSTASSASLLSRSLRSSTGGCFLLLFPTQSLGSHSLRGLSSHPQSLTHSLAHSRSFAFAIRSQSLLYAHRLNPTQNSSLCDHPRILHTRRVDPRPWCLQRRKLGMRISDSRYETSHSFSPCINKHHEIHNTKHRLGGGGTPLGSPTMPRNYATPPSPPANEQETRA